ncbi:hypothetical protein BT67DRAFT_434642 [Trichocladium antarcticum]|uniref:Uncharacterized protein n=1 Tax=Trichocladium antarcticum TaxID=1450529 RepID=A0AAN6ZDC2_9PEZI|nr:hypothetical protein BT67DRAFT_434642 [Trichocladium antarcticum]
MPPPTCTHSLIRDMEMETARNNARAHLALLGDNLADSLADDRGLPLTHQMESQLQALEHHANDRIALCRRVRDNDPCADLQAVEVAVEEAVAEFCAGKAAMYTRLAQEHGERQTARVYDELGGAERLPRAYLDILYETWDVVELEEGAQDGGPGRGELEEEPVVVASMV